MNTTLYCDITDVENRLSQSGVALREDDDPPTLHGDVIDEASATIEAYCLTRYGPDQLLKSRIVKHWCSNVAALLLCERRGNPVPNSIASKFDRTMADLERVNEGKFKIGDIPMRFSAVPQVSNMRPALRPAPHAVVERRRSTHKPAAIPQKNIDPLDGLNQLPDQVT